jgi:hypothetical protein
MIANILVLCHLLDHPFLDQPTLALLAKAMLYIFRATTLWDRWDMTSPDKSGGWYRCDADLTYLGRRGWIDDCEYSRSLSPSRPSTLALLAKAMLYIFRATTLWDRWDMTSPDKSGETTNLYGDTETPVGRLS